MHLKLSRQPPKAAKPDPEVALVLDRLEQFGRKWEVQSCAAGSNDPSCQLQAAKSLTALVGLLEQHKAVAHRPQTRHVASRAIPWSPLLVALLAPIAHPSARTLALPAIASLVGCLPEVVPLECCPLLVALLDPPVADWDGPVGQLAAGSHAIICLLALVPHWRSAAMRPHWIASQGLTRLRTHLARCVAAAAAATVVAVAATVGPARGGVRGPGGGGGGEVCVALAAALRLVFVMVRMAGYVRQELLAQMRSWLPLLLDAHAAATPAPASTTAPTTAPHTRRSSLGLESQAWVLAILRLLSTSRRFWAAALPLPSSPPPPCGFKYGGAGDDGGGGGAGRTRYDRSIHCRLAATLPARLLSTLSVHVRARAPAQEPSRQITAASCIGGGAAKGGGSNGKGSSNPAPQLLPPLLPAAAALLCHPGLWRNDLGGGGNDVYGGPQGVGGASSSDDGGDAAERLLAAARGAVIEGVLLSVLECAVGGPSTAVAAAAAAAPLLPVLAAALAPAPVPYGSKVPTWRPPDSPLWDKALVLVLALSVRQLLGGPGSLKGAAAATVDARTTAAPGDGDTHAAEAVTAALGSGTAAGGGGDDCTAMATSAWLLLRLLARVATAEQIKQAAQLSGRMTLAANVPGADPGDTGTPATATAAAAARARSSSASLPAAAAAAWVLLWHFKSLGQTGGAEDGRGGVSLSGNGWSDCAGGEGGRQLLWDAAELEGKPLWHRLIRLQVLAAAAASTSTPTNAAFTPSSVAAMSASGAPGQRRFQALEACCRELAATPTLTAPPLPASLYGILGCTALHACLSAMLRQTSAGAADAADGHTKGQPAAAAAGGAAGVVPDNASALQSLLVRLSAGAVPFAAPPAGDGGGGDGDGGADSSDMDSDSEGGKCRSGGWVDGEEAVMQAAVGGTGAATAQLCRTVSQLVSYEVSCVASALLSACVGRLGTAAAALPPAIAPHTVDGGAMYSSADRWIGAGGEDPYGGCVTCGFSAGDLLEEYADAAFNFPTSDARPAPLQPASAQPQGPPNATSGVATATGARPGADGLETVAVPAALVAAGCPVLAARLRRALREKAAAVREAPGDGFGEGDTGAERARPGAEARGGGGGGGGGDGGSGRSSGQRGARIGSGRVVVVGWPRTLRVPTGSRVPRRAFRTVLEYLTKGEAVVQPLPYDEAVPPPVTERRQGGPPVAAGPPPAQALREPLREVASLASALDLPALRAAARGAPPQPGNTPPPPMPRLQPLLPSQLLVLPQPQPQPKPQPPSYTPAERQGRHSEGQEGGVLDGAPSSEARRHQPGSRHLGGCYPHPHPHLEEQLTSIARWEEEQDALARQASQFRTRAGNERDVDASEGDGGDGDVSRPRGLPPFPAVHICCLDGSGAAANWLWHDGGGTATADGSRGHPGVWPADAVIAAPLLPHPAAAAVFAPRATSGLGTSEPATPQSGTPREGAPAESAAGGGDCGVGGVRGGGPGGSDGSGGGLMGCRTVLVPVHRVVLAARCEYFAALCSDRWQPSCSRSDGRGGDGAGGSAPGGRYYLRPVSMCAAAVEHGATDGGGGTAGEQPLCAVHVAATAIARPSPMPASARCAGRDPLSGQQGDPEPRSDPEPGSDRDVDLALRVKLLRSPGCDADVVVAVLRYLHSQHAQHARHNDLDADTRGGVADRPFPPGAEQVKGGWLAPPLPLRACEWAPLRPSRTLAAACPAPPAEMPTLPAAPQKPSPSPATPSPPAVAGTDAGDDGAGGAGGRCGQREGQHRGGREEEQEVVEAVDNPACPACQELRLCLRVLLASNALLLPGLQHLATQHALHLLRQQGFLGVASPPPPPLSAGCLLTAARDGSLLQLPWLVTAAVEELTRRFDSANVWQTPEWFDLPDQLQRAALEGWSRRARRTTTATTMATRKAAVGAAAAIAGVPSAATEGNLVRQHHGGIRTVIRRTPAAAQSAAGGLDVAMQTLAEALVTTM